MQDSREFIRDDLGWSGSSISCLNGALANIIANVEGSGLEGASYPVVLSSSSSRLLQDESITPRDSHWMRFLRVVDDENLLRTKKLREWLKQRGAVIDLELRLTGALATTVNETTLRDLLARDDLLVKVAELDSPGALELNVSSNAINIPGVPAELELRGDGQIVAVLDGEIVRDHPGLEGRVVQKGNYASTDWNVADGNLGESFARSHATRVAGIIAGNGLGRDGQTPYIGIAPEAQIWNYKIAPSRKRGTPVVAALEQAHFDGARIINLSWGKNDADRDGTSVWSRTVDALFQQGTLVCKSAGNDGPERSTITSPSDARYVIAVGATNRSGQAVHEGSSRGPTEDGRTKPDVLAPGGGTVSAVPPDTFEATHPPGTSYAAPFVSGLSALLWQSKPNATVAQIRTAILSSCRKIPETDASVQGNGTIDAAQAITVLNSDHNDP